MSDKREMLESVLAIAAAVLVAAMVAWAGSDGGIRIAGVSLMALAAAVAFLIQWVAFVPAYRAQTERYYDLVGSLTFLSVTIGTFLVAARFDVRSVVLVLLVSIWALRLGRFLFERIKREGSDRRFDAIKPSLTRFLMAWTLQGLWVFLTLAAALAALTATAPAPPLGPIGLIGIVVWTAGFAIEALSDAQKRAFRNDPANAGRFIATGLWAWSRHPNYFGEILIWIGIALIALPALTGWQHVTLVSPLFVYLLLTRVSGIPMLEARADEHWGDDPDYQAYRGRTPVLFPRPPR
jgi:steroid 5-alpha reductase family enzyme